MSGRAHQTKAACIARCISYIVNIKGSKSTPPVLVFNIRSAFLGIPPHLPFHLFLPFSSLFSLQISKRQRHETNGNQPASKRQQKETTYVDLVAGSGGTTSTQDGGRGALDGDNKRRIVC